MSGLFQLLFHTKAAHYSNLDLTNYREILLRTNAQKTKISKHIIKNLFIEELREANIIK